MVMLHGGVLLILSILVFDSCIKDTFLYSAALQWNNLPTSLIVISGANTFKTALKRWVSSYRLPYFTESELMYSK